MLVGCVVSLLHSRGSYDVKELSLCVSCLHPKFHVRGNTTRMYL